AGRSTRSTTSLNIQIIAASIAGTSTMPARLTSSHLRYGLASGQNRRTIWRTGTGGAAGTSPPRSRGGRISREMRPRGAVSMAGVRAGGTDLVPMPPMPRRLPLLAGAHGRLVVARRRGLHLRRVRAGVGHRAGDGRHHRLEVMLVVTMTMTVGHLCPPLVRVMPRT